MEHTIGAEPFRSQRGGMPIAAFVADRVLRIDPDATLLDVADAMSAAEVGALLIAHGDDVRAIVSERDLVHALATRQDPCNTTAGEIGHTRLVWCDVHATVGDVAMKMMDEYVRHILVEEDGALAGIVSARDLLGAYATADPSAALDGTW